MATNDQTLTISINLNPGKGQSRAATTQVIDKTMFDMKNLIMENVAFFMAAKQEKALTNNLNRVFGAIVDSELKRMGRQINQFVIGVNDKSTTSNVIGTNDQNAVQRSKSAFQTGPQGSLAITGGVAKAMQGQTGPVTLSSGTGPWPARSQKYLKQKRAKYGHNKWFKNTGSLGRYLALPSTYYNAYGPVRVTFARAAKGSNLANVIGVSSIPTGVPGKRTSQIRVGTVEVGVLSRITNDMLNSAGQPQPSAWNTGLFASMDPVQEAKLLNREEFYRPFLEHFLSFYLTRAIPNAVFRRIEQVTKNALATEVS